MLSRVAESLFWMAHYVERAENVARLLDAGFQFQLDAAGAAAGPLDDILTILACRADYRRTRPAAASRPTAAATAEAPAAAGRSVLHFLTFDRHGSHSVLSMVALARENARSTQEVLSADAWSQVNRLHLYLSGPRAERRFQASPFRFYDGVKRACVLFAGLVDGTLRRTEVFHFLQLGRYLERVDMMSRILAANAAHAAARNGSGPDLHWTSLRRSCSAYEAYLHEHHHRVEPPLVVRYLILEPDFPRSMRFGVDRCLDSLREIAGRHGDDYASEAERLLGRFDGELRYLDPEEIVSRGLHHSSPRCRRRATASAPKCGGRSS